jgi:hypothetical protein
MSDVFSASAQEADTHRAADAAVVSGPGPVWACKIGSVSPVFLPRGSDAPMRAAVKRAYFDLTGEYAEFTFSGWSAELTEPERAVVENRLPDPSHYQAERVRDAAPDLLEAARLAEDIIDDFLGHLSPDEQVACAEDPKAAGALKALRGAISKASTANSVGTAEAVNPENPLSDNLGGAGQ